MTTKTKTPSTYYVRCAAQAERDALLDYAVARGARDGYGTQWRGSIEEEPFAKVYKTRLGWRVCSDYATGSGDIELTPDSFKRKVRKLWPKKAKVERKPAAKAPRKVSQLDRIEQRLRTIDVEATRHFVAIQRDLSLIRSGMETRTEEKNARQLQDMKEIGEKWDAEEAPKPAGLQPGDYCQADEHHDLKEVAERLTAMGWEWNDIDRHELKYIRYGLSSAAGKMINIHAATSMVCYPTPEFLSRAEVTAKGLGLTPVVPEPWVRGDYFTHEDGSVDRVRYERDGFIHSYDGFRSYHVSRCRKMSPSEVAAYQEAIASKEEAAMKLGKLSLGVLVQTPDGEGAYWFHNTAQGHKVVFEKGRVGTFNIDELTIVQ